MSKKLANQQQLTIIDTLAKQVHPKRLELFKKGFPTILTVKAAKRLIILLKRETKQPNQYKIKLKDELTKKLETKLATLNPEALDAIRQEPFTKGKAVHYRNKLRNLIREAGGKVPRVVRKRETRIRSRNFYLTYICSKEWEDKKVEFRTSGHYRGCCYVCDSKGLLDIHHDTYVNLGNEKLEDLLELCRGCHDILHRRVKHKIYRKITGSAEKMKIERCLNTTLSG